VGRWGRRHRRGGTAAALTLVVAGVATAVGGLAGAATGGSNPDNAVVRAVSPAAQQAARAFWTPSQMAAAAPAPALSPASAGPAVSPPRGIPTARQFNGVLTVGALFFTTRRTVHFCTASVVDSTHEDLVITAAHCVYSGGFASNIEFVPGFHSGREPRGAWVVKTITVATGWVRSQNQNLDFAFLAVAPPRGTRRPIQQVTGGLRLGISRPYRRPIEVVGYNNTDSRPVECATHSFRFEANQMEFYCHDFRDGTSGAPWIIHYDSRNGTGDVFGVIGGFEQGGLLEWASYSSYFGRPALDLYLVAER
jgi:V8-like Glu-specific endopeptidase